MFVDQRIYDGIQVTAVGRVLGDVQISAYATRGSNGKPDFIEFYRITFSIACENHFVRRFYYSKKRQLKINTEVYRVVLTAKNPDFLHVMYKGTIIHVNGIPKVSPNMMRLYKSPMYIDATGYKIMRIPAYIDKESGEIVKIEPKHHDTSKIRFYVRDNRSEMFKIAPRDFVPNNINTYDRQKYEINSDEFDDINSDYHGELNNDDEFFD